MLKKLGSQIAARRRGCGLSRKRLAALAGITITTLTRIEETGRSTSGKMLPVLRALGLELRAARVRR